MKIVKETYEGIVQIEATRWDGDEDTYTFLKSASPRSVQRDSTSSRLFVQTPTGISRAEVGDYIVYGPMGFFYVVNPDKFEKQYKPVRKSHEHS